ncbi:MAG: AMP-binding protein [Rhodocyclales bacterium]|nr:AMP-binding protein [Rhodocyclales bacterium]
MNRDCFDPRETRDAAERERELFARLPAQVAHAKSQSPYYADALASVEPGAITSRAALARLPVLRKHQLIAIQKSRPPFGGLEGTPLAGLAQVFASPGPIYEAEGREEDNWRFARGMYAAGFRPGDLVYNTFSYHFTPGGFMAHGGAKKLGCPVFAAGVGQSELQVQAIQALRPAGYVGTPSFLKILIEKADETGTDISSLKKAVVSGEALFPAQKALFAERGIAVYQAFATADLGMIAFETPAREGLVLDEDLILEIVRPGTGDPVPEGEVGEIVVTTFNRHYPLVRFGTGDMTAILPGFSPCGRSNMRIKGWLGRADQTTKVKGMFVHPEQVAAVVKRHPGISRARLVVTNPEGNDVMTLHCEAAASEALKAAIADSVRDVTKLRGEVVFVAPGGLANDGKVIADERKYD